MSGARQIAAVVGAGGGYGAALRMARNAQQAGADAVLLFSSPYGSEDAEGAYRYFKRRRRCREDRSHPVPARAGRALAGHNPPARGNSQRHRVQGPERRNRGREVIRRFGSRRLSLDRRGRRTRGEGVSGRRQSIHERCRCFCSEGVSAILGSRRLRPA